MTDCEKCGSRLVLPAGPVKSPVLLVGEFAGWEELKAGVPWVGKAGQVLRDEMSRAGLSIDRCRQTNLWLHGKDEENCDKDWHLTQLKKELLGRAAVLLMGSDVLAEFLPGESVSDWNGLEILSPELPRSVKVCVAAFNPAISLYDKLGETRFALMAFVAAAKEYV